MPADAGAEMNQTELLEALRFGFFGREMRLQEARQAFVRHLRRQPEGIGLERVARVDAVRVNRAPPSYLDVVVTEQAEHQPSHLRIAQVEQVPGAIEAETLLLDRDRVPAGLRFLLEQAMRDAGLAERQRRRHAREPGAQHDRRRSL